ncbi:MAG TPA: YggS family pyridoxal phosphate-dependent enzyme [Myxococcales bacterium]|nr:YggS family pyridoxal phosphate-dependent enzyme [Deltaproteobacteria bacterium]MBU54496.1 YggS family pyridoxal phosphate-dependent enzyme [Deltaproteobacteria bacterium]HAA57019.1 YggS family pyridoxal phosphate-dependent enzyme [Myxococcales bacterium]
MKERSMGAIAERFNQVKQRIQIACDHANRSADEITLLAISKTQPVEALLEVWQEGQSCFGENYVQEWRSKYEALHTLESEGLTWHFTGRLQRNKCKYLAGKVGLIHTIDSLSLLKEVEKRTPEGHTQDVLIQLNLAQEESKSGFQTIEELRSIFQPETPWKRIKLCGLMTIPPQGTEEETRAHFRQIKQAQQTLQSQYAIELPELSMGMSGDLEIAIEEGATIIRVGTAIFGQRK